MATKEVTKEVGIIGQMYEDRKSGRVGVLESRDEKYKTLLMRDTEGKTFNIVFSTFRSNWRKYNGDKVIQTSTQVEEYKAKTEKTKKDAEKVVESKQEVVKLTTEDKVKKLRALEELVSSIVKEKGAEFTVSRKSKGGVLVSYKHLALFEVWERFKVNKFDVPVRECVVAHDRDGFDPIIKMTDYEYKDSWVLKHCCTTTADKLNDIISAVVDASMKYVATKKENEKPSKQKKVKNEEE